MISKSLKMTEKNLSKYHSVLFKWLNENSKSSSFFEEIHALISDYAKVSVQSSVTCCDFLFIPIVSVQWPMVGRQAWCHILSEKNVSTRSPNLQRNRGAKISKKVMTSLDYDASPSSLDWDIEKQNEDCEMSLNFRSH